MRVGLRARFASLRVERTRCADGREWEVHVHRCQWRPPGPRHEDPVSDEGLAFLDEVVGALWFVIALPAAVVRRSRSRTRRVEAICWWPNEVRMLWETDAAHVEAVAKEVARQVQQGYEHLAPANATFVGFTDPPAGPDRALPAP